MTIQEIQERVDEIAKFTESSPAVHAGVMAHEMEDDLRADFLAYVQDNPTDPELSAKTALVLSTSEIKFHRRYA